MHGAGKFNIDVSMFMYIVSNKSQTVFIFASHSLAYIWSHDYEETVNYLKATGGPSVGYISITD